LIWAQLAGKDNEVMAVAEKVVYQFHSAR